MAEEKVIILRDTRIPELNEGRFNKKAPKTIKKKIIVLPSSDEEDDETEEHIIYRKPPKAKTQPVEKQPELPSRKIIFFSEIQIIKSIVN